MKWVAEVPATGIPCGEGTFDIQIANAEAALSIAKMASSAYVTAQVSGAAAEAIRRSPELAQKLSPLPAPELFTFSETPRNCQIPLGEFRSGASPSRARRPDDDGKKEPHVEDAGLKS